MTGLLWSFGFCALFCHVNSDGIMFFSFFASLSIGGLYSVTTDFLQDTISCAGGFSLARKQSHVESTAKRINTITLTEQNEVHILIKQN